MHFCLRDDDTSFFTSPEDLEHAYGEVSQWGPVSLAIVPFCRAGMSKWIPEKFRRKWSVHPLHENRPLVEYLRAGIAAGRFEAMLHGYHHDVPSGRGEFVMEHDLARRVTEGRRYLEELLGTTIRVFVAPHNAIGREGLLALAHEGLHLGGAAGIRSGWPYSSRASWSLWLKLRRWRKSGGVGVPWVLDLGDHREIGGNPVTPTATLQQNITAFDQALAVEGVFCAATHYWELDVPNVRSGEPTVGEHLRHLIDRALAHPNVVWGTVGEAISKGAVAI